MQAWLVSGVVDKRISNFLGKPQMPVRRNSRGCRCHQEFATSSAGRVHGIDKFPNPRKERDAIQELHYGFNLRWTISSDSVQTRYRDYMELPKIGLKKWRHSTRNAVNIEPSSDYHPLTELLSLPSSVWHSTNLPPPRHLKMPVWLCAMTCPARLKGKPKSFARIFPRARLAQTAVHAGAWLVIVSQWMTK